MRPHLHLVVLMSQPQTEETVTYKLEFMVPIYQQLPISQLTKSLSQIYTVARQCRPCGGGGEESDIVMRV